MRTSNDDRRSTDSIAPSQDTRVGCEAPGCQPQGQDAMFRTIPLTQGHETTVSVEDYAALSQYRWHYHSAGYAVRNTWADGRYTTVLMHREILNPPAGYQVDHVDGDRTNNVRQNLRLATFQQNRCNRRLNRNSTCGLKGVFQEKRTGRWRAQIQTNGRRLYLGTYPTPEQAAGAYDLKAIELHGEFARLNFPTSADADSDRVGGELS